MFDHKQNVSIEKPNKIESNRLTGMAIHYEGIFRDIVCTTNFGGIVGDTEKGLREIALELDFVFIKIKKLRMAELRKNVEGGIILIALCWGNPKWVTGNSILTS
jgi:hypothetical protein